MIKNPEAENDYALAEFYFLMLSSIKAGPKNPEYTSSLLWIKGHKLRLMFDAQSVEETSRKQYASEVLEAFKSL